MQATCSLSADVFAGAETTLKERRSPEQKVGKRESLRAAVAVLQLFKSLLSLARPGQYLSRCVFPGRLLRRTRVQDARCDPELARRDDDEHACRTARTRGRSGLYAATRRRGDDAARVRGCRPRCRSSSLHQLA